MSDKFEFSCRSCHGKCLVPLSFVGKRGKCPSCRTVLTIPDPVEAFLNESDDEVPIVAAARPPRVSYRQATYEEVDEYRPAPRRSRRRRGVRRSRRPVMAKSDQAPSAFDWVSIFLCPGIACLLGLVAMIQGYTKRGGIMLGLSLVWGLMLNVILAASGQMPAGMY